MTFLNFILLGGIAAASLPVLIHLFNKNRFRTVRWGAMHLLDATFETNKRRLRLEHLLLLFIRCLIPTLLALCMARPVFIGAAKLLGAEKSSLVILLDNSYSMDTGGAGNSNFAQARDAATKIIESAARGSDLTVLLMAGGVAPLVDPPTFDAARLNQELSHLDAGYGQATVPDSLEAAAATLAKMTQPYRELVIISDFQRVSWSDKESATRAHAAELLQKMPLPPQVTLLHVGTEGKDNVSVGSLDFSRLVFGKGQPMQVRANLHNWGEREYSDLRVYFRVDGRERSASQVSLTAGESKQVLFNTAFDTASSHFIEVYADADALKADNSYLAAVPVWDEVPALLVNGDPSAEPLKGETDFLQIALQPFGQAKADLTDLITTRVIETRDLTAQALTKMRVLVLANVRQLTDPQLAAVRDFVRDGGGLLIFPGNRINAEWYNTTLFGTEKILPLPLATLAGSLEENGRRARVVAERYNHPALELFNDPRNGNLGEAEIKLWFRTGPRPPASDPTFNVLAQLDNGDAFLAERKFGEGRVMLCATACDADWSNLPVRPFYLPLMQRLVTYLASTVFPPRNVEVGKPLGAFFSAADAGKRATFTDPAGIRSETPITLRGTRGFTEFTKTLRPGLYVMTSPDNATTHFVVNTSREESDLRQLTEPERAAVAKAMGAKLVKSVKEYLQLDNDRRFGKEVWQSLLWFVLALAFLELALEQWFARKR